MAQAVGKPNSCLYRAVEAVVKLQFGIDISPSRHIFDGYNTLANGIPFADIVDAINEALDPWQIGVTDIYGEITGEFKYRSLCHGKGFAAAPCIAFLLDQEHAIACLPGNGQHSCTVAWVLGKK